MTLPDTLRIRPPSEYPWLALALTRPSGRSRYSSTDVRTSICVMTALSTIYSVFQIRITIYCVKEAVYRIFRLLDSGQGCGKRAGRAVRCRSAMLRLQVGLAFGCVGLRLC